MTDPVQKGMDKVDDIAGNIIEGLTGIPNRLVDHADHVVDNGAKTFTHVVDKGTGNIDQAIGNVVGAADKVVGGAVDGVDKVLDHGSDQVSNLGHNIASAPEKGLQKAEKMLP